MKYIRRFTDNDKFTEFANVSRGTDFEVLAGLKVDSQDSKVQWLPISGLKATGATGCRPYFVINPTSSNPMIYNKISDDPETFTIEETTTTIDLYVYKYVNGSRIIYAGTTENINETITKSVVAYSIDYDNKTAVLAEESIEIEFHAPDWTKIIINPNNRDYAQHVMYIENWDAYLYCSNDVTSCTDNDGNNPKDLYLVEYMLTTYGTESYEDGSHTLYPVTGTTYSTSGTMSVTTSNHRAIPASTTSLRQELSLDGQETYKYRGSISEINASQTDLVSIELPLSMDKISIASFMNCANLSSITIPSSITSIGNGIFWGCTALKNIIIPDSVTRMGNTVFCACTSLESVVLSNNLQIIEESAFLGCTSLTGIVIPDSVKTIKNQAFSGCSAMASLDLGNSITTIEMSAFAGCDGLTSIVVPNSVKTLGNRVFARCSNLTSVSLPSSLESIPTSLFYNCTLLTTINYSGTMNQWNALSKGNDWKYQIAATSVHCSDGDVELS